MSSACVHGSPVLKKKKKGSTVQTVNSFIIHNYGFVSQDLQNYSVNNSECFNEVLRNGICLYARRRRKITFNSVFPFFAACNVCQRLVLFFLNDFITFCHSM